MRLFMFTHFAVTQCSLCTPFISLLAAHRLSHLRMPLFSKRLLRLLSVVPTTFPYSYSSSFCAIGPCVASSVQRTMDRLDAWGAGPLPRPNASLLALLTHSHAQHCSLSSHTPLRSFPRLLAHSLAHPGAHGKVGYDDDTG